MLPALISGKIKVLAWPATGEPLRLVAATTGGERGVELQFAVYREIRRSRFKFSVAFFIISTVSPLPEPLVE